MPKASRRRKTRAARSEAAAGPSTSASPAGKGAAREKQVLPIITALSSENPSDRLFACAGLANLLCECDVPTRRLLGSHKIVDQMIARCNVTLEPDASVRAEAVGALRNLAVEGGAEVCSEMFNKGILPVIMAHLPLILQTLPTQEDGDSAMNDEILTEEQEDDQHKRKTILWDWSENLITLIWCIAEGSSKALPILSLSRELVSFLVTILNNYIQTPNDTKSDNAPLAVPLSALHTLSVLTDSNSSFTKTFLSAEENLDPLLHYIRSAASAGKKHAQRHMLRILSVSVLLNLTTSGNAENAILNKKQKSMVADIKKELDEKALWFLILGLHQEDSAEVEERLQDLQITLEVLGEMCNSLDGFAMDEAEAEEWNGIGDDKEAGDEEMDEDVDNPETAAGDGLSVDGEEEGEAAALDADTTLEINSTTREALVKSNLVPTLIKLAKPTSTSPEEIPTSHNASLSPVQSAQLLVCQRALEALNNLLFTLARANPPQPVVQTEVLQSTWVELFNLLVSFASAPKPTLIEPLLGCIWALAQICLADQKEWIGVGQGETPSLLNLLQGESSEEAKVRCVGALGVLATRKGVSVDENQVVGSALLSPFSTLAVGQQAPISLLVQALDSLFDIYGDETREYDVPVFRQKQFLPTLKEAASTFKVLTKKIDKRKQPELRSRAEGACTNLTAFIKYRQSI